MKKNIRLNKQIIKALSVGISASMLLQPVTAFADELDTTTPDPVTDGAEDTTAKTAYEATEEVADEASVSVNAAIDASNEAVDAVNEDDATNKVVEARDSFETAISENEAELKQDIVDAKTDVEAMDEKATVIAADVSAANVLAGEANAAAVSANDAVDAGNAIADAIDVSVNDAVASVSANETALLNAGTIGEANAIYDEINKTVTDTNTAVNRADDELTALETEYNTAEGIYDTKSAAYESVLEQLALAQAAYDEIKDNAAGDEGETQDALERLENLKREAVRLQAEAQAAYNQFTKSGYGLIAKYEMQAKNPSAYDVTDSQKWDKILDKLFNTVMKVYYVPEMVSTEENQCTFVSAKWHKNKANDALNYCVVTYKDAEGNTHTEILNYRLDNENKDGGFVIFEKTPHVIMGDVDVTGADYEALTNPEGDGYIIKEFNGQKYIVMMNEDGQFVVYDGNDKDPDEESVTEGTSEDGLTTVAIENETEEYSINEDGNLVKTVKGDVVTTVSSGKQLIAASGNVNTTEQAAKAAYIAALQAKLDGLGDNEVLVIGETELGKDYVIDEENPIGYVSTSDSDEVTTGYTVSGTYNKKFKDTVNISGTANSESKARSAYDDKVNNYADGFKYVDKDGFLFIGGEHQQDYYFLDEQHDDPTITANWDTKSELQKVGTEPVYLFGVHLFDRDVYDWVDVPYIKNYGYSGSVTVGHYNLESEDLSKWAVLDDISDFFTGRNTEEEIKQAWTEILAREGKKFIAYDGYDWTQGFLGIGEAKVYYVDATETGNVSVDATTEEAARAAFIASLADVANADDVNISSAVANTTTNYTYGYDELEYFIKAVTVEQQATISTTTWATVLGNATLEYRNDKFDEGDIILAEYDYTDKRDYITDAKAEKNLEGKDVAQTADFRKKVDRAAEVANMYLDTVAKCKSAAEAIEAAKTKVQELEDEIKKLTAAGASIDTINAIKGNLVAARAKLDAAKAKRDELVKKLDQIEDELNQKIQELTPPQVNPTNPTEEITVPEEGTPLAPTIFAAAPAAPAAPAVVAEIPEDEVPEVDEPVVDEPVQVADIEDDQTALAAAPVTVGDDATPLASIPDQKEMSWWWLLIVLILGATGAEMYRRHMAKKKAAEVNTTDTK